MAPALTPQRLQRPPAGLRPLPSRKPVGRRRSTRPPRARRARRSGALWASLAWGTAVVVGAAVLGPLPAVDADDGPTKTPPSQAQGPPTSSKGGPGSGQGRTGAADDGQDDDEEDDAGTDEDDEEAGDAEGARPPGRFAVTSGSYQGRFVAFDLQSDPCAVTNHRVGDVAFLRAVHLGGSCGVEARSDHSSFLNLDGQAADARVHDNPNGLIRFDARGGSVEVGLAPGVVAQRDADHASLVLANRTAHLWVTGQGALTLNGTQLVLSDGRATFWVEPANGSRTQPDEVVKAIGARKVAGQVDVLVTNGTTVHEALAFDDVVLKVRKKAGLTFRVLIDGDLSGGRTFVLNFAPGALGAGRVDVRFFDVEDGTSENVPVPITQAEEGLRDILEAEPGEGPEYWVVHDTAGTHVLVSVPSFSVHVVELSSVVDVVPPNVIAGAALAVVTAGGAGAFMFKGRRRQF